MNYSKTVPLLIGVLTLTFLIIFLVFAWTEPTSAPPGGNVDAPINTGSAEQTKTGGLGLGDSTTPTSSGFLKLINSVGNWETGFNGDSWKLKWSEVLNPAIQIGSDGNVGIGTTNPGTAKLKISGGILDVDSNRITNVDTPSAAKDAVNYETMQSALAGDGGGAMSGTINLYGPGPYNYGIRAFPLALPGNNCQVKITACDYASVPPISLTISPDPINPTSPSSTEPPSSSYTGPSCGLEVTGTYTDEVCYTKCSPCSVPEYECRTGICANTTTARCRNTEVDSCITTGDFTQCYRYDQPCCRIYVQDYAITLGGCCPPGTSNLSGFCCPTGYVQSSGRCCPPDHPVYDAATEKCLKASSYSTFQAGNCTTFTATLSGIQDFSFDNNNADSVIAAYTCP